MNFYVTTVRTPRESKLDALNEERKKTLQESRRFFETARGNAFLIAFVLPPTRSSAKTYYLGRCRFVDSDRENLRMFTRRTDIWECVCLSRDSRGQSGFPILDRTALRTRVENLFVRKTTRL